MNQLRIQDISGDAVWVVGQGSFTNVLVTGSFTAFRYFLTSDTNLSHATLTENDLGLQADFGVHPPGPPVGIAVSDSILWSNGLDIEAIGSADPCVFLQRTITSTSDNAFDCTGINGIQHTDPKLLAGVYTVSSSSPALDRGPDPILYNGVPCTDLDGGPRLRDHDGDGLAQSDMGAFERENPSRTRARFRT